MYLWIMGIVNKVKCLYETKARCALHEMPQGVLQRDIDKGQMRPEK